MAKLRILCLHGWNNNADVMKFQMQSFIKTFGDLVEFDFIDGPWEVVDDKPEKFLVAKGFKPPFRGWTQYTNI